MQALTTEQIRALIARGKLKDNIFKALGILCLAIGLLVIVLLITDMVIKGSERFTLDFFTNFASRRAGQAGILSAWVGSLLVMLVTALAAVPLGVAAGLYLEEYAKRNWITNIIEINITNLAAVPSIVYGLLALGVFVYQFGFGQSILSAGLTLALLILPIIIVFDPRSDPLDPGDDPRRFDGGWCHPLADLPLPHHSLRHARHPDRRHHRSRPRHRRNGADHHHWRADLHRLPAAAALHRRAAGRAVRLGDVALYRDADPDLQLDLASGPGFRDQRRRRRLRADGHGADDERHCDLAALQVAQEHQMVIVAVDA